MKFYEFKTLWEEVRGTLNSLPEGKRPGGRWLVVDRLQLSAPVLAVVVCVGALAPAFAEQQARASDRGVNALSPTALSRAAAPNAFETEGWPEFRGPNRNGASLETDWTAKWPAHGLRKIWETKLASDFSCLSIQGGRIYTMGTQNITTKTKTYCLDAATGKALWEYPVSKPIDDTGSASTPAVSGTRVIAVGADGRIVCLNREDGTLIWDVPMGLRRAMYCYASSPLIHKATVIVPAGPAIRAFDLTNGKPLWKTDWQIPPDGGRWSSPVLGVFDGQETVVCLSRSNLVGLNPDDGSLRWKHLLETKPQGEDLANTPVIVENRIAFMAFRAEAARKTRIVCVEIKNGTPKESWRSKDKLGNRTQSLVAWDNCLYLTSSGIHEAKGRVNCFDLQTGNVLWVSSVQQPNSPLPAGKSVETFNDGGAFMIAGGKMLLLNGAGHVTVSEISAKGCTLLSDADVSTDLKSSHAWCGWQFVVPPLLLNGRLYLRNHERLVCYEVQR